MEDEELKRRVARLEALFSVLLLFDTDGEQRFPSSVFEVLHESGDERWLHALHDMLRRRRRSSPQLEDRVEAVERTQQRSESANAQLRVDLYRMMWLLSLDDDRWSVPFQRPVPIRVYTKATPVPGDAAFIPTMATKFADSLGFATVAAGADEFGSFFKELWGRATKAIAGEESRDLLTHGERALQLQLVDKPQAAVDRDVAEAAERMMRALEPYDEGIVQVGSLLLVKRIVDGRKLIVVKQLTLTELRRVEREPALLRSPNTILDVLTAPEVRKGDDAVLSSAPKELDPGST